MNQIATKTQRRKAVSKRPAEVSGGTKSFFVPSFLCGKLYLSKIGVTIMNQIATKTQRRKAVSKRLQSLSLCLRSFVANYI